MRKTFTTICLIAGVGAAIAGCGSSSGSGTTAAGITTAPSGGSSGVTTSSSTSSTKLPSAFNTEPTIKTPGGTPPTKLETKDLIVGTGTKVTSPTQTVTISYVGALYSNGKVFDSSWKDDPSTHTITQPLSGFVPGFQQGILGMRVGGRREITIPPKLAYGSKPQKGIPANSTLIFIVDLHAVS